MTQCQSCLDLFARAWRAECAIETVLTMWDDAAGVDGGFDVVAAIEVLDQAAAPS